MTFILHFFILFPLVGFLVSLFLPPRKEELISWWSFTTVGLHLFAASAFFVYWLMDGHPVVNIKDIALYQTSDYSFFLDFYFDRITAVYLLTGAVLTFLVSIYCRYYMHREEG